MLTGALIIRAYMARWSGFDYNDKDRFYILAVYTLLSHYLIIAVATKRIE